MQKRVLVALMIWMFIINVTSFADDKLYNKDYIYNEDILIKLSNQGVGEIHELGGEIKFNGIKLKIDGKEYDYKKMSEMERVETVPFVKNEIAEVKYKIRQEDIEIIEKVRVLENCANAKDNVIKVDYIFINKSDKEKIIDISIAEECSQGDEFNVTSKLEEVKVIQKNKGLIKNIIKYYDSNSEKPTKMMIKKDLKNIKIEILETYWDGIKLKPRECKKISLVKAVEDFKIHEKKELDIILTGIDKIRKTDLDMFSLNVVEIEALLINNSEKDIENMDVEVFLPKGLELFCSEKINKIKKLKMGEQKSIVWKVLIGIDYNMEELSKIKLKAKYGGEEKIKEKRIIFGQENKEFKISDDQFEVLSNEEGDFELNYLDENKYKVEDRILYGQHAVYGNTSKTFVKIGDEKYIIDKDKLKNECRLYEGKLLTLYDLDKIFVRQILELEKEKKRLKVSYEVENRSNEELEVEISNLLDLEGKIKLTEDENIVKIKVGLNKNDAIYEFNEGMVKDVVVGEWKKIFKKREIASKKDIKDKEILDEAIFIRWNKLNTSKGDECKIEYYINY